MTHRRSISWRFAIAAVALAMGIYFTANPPPGTPMKPSAAALASGRALDRKLSELDFAQTPLSRALKVIGSAAGFSTKFDLRGFREEGIDPAGLVVTAHLRDVRASKALDVVLSDACPQYRLQYFNDNGTIVMTTPRGQARRAETRIYNISDLFGRKFQLTDQQEAQLDSAIARLITETVDPQSWKVSGGTVNSLQLDRGILTVRQTPENLRLIGGLLGQMRDGEESQRLARLLQEDGG